jgi:hypothetical protein
MPDDPTPDKQPAAATGAKKKSRGGRNLLDLKPALPEVEDHPELDIPIEEMDGKTPSISLGLTTEEMEFIFPYIGLQVSVRMGQQFQLAIGEYVVDLLISNEIAEQNGWKSAAQEISKGLHAQSIKWLYNRPEAGLTIKVEKRETPGEGGGG